MAIGQTRPEEAYELLQQGYRYIDVRTEPEFTNGHPATAVNIPVVVPDPMTGQMVVNADFLAVVATHFDKAAKLILGCQSGMRSQRAAALLAQAGYTDVLNMQGGFGGARDPSGRSIVSGWAECGLPVCQDCEADSSYAGLRAAVK